VDGPGALGVSGESPVAVFVSSVMRPELETPRTSAHSAILRLGWVPWLFEATPPSPDGAVETYLRKVRECDVFVWLTNGVTTQPVADEVREALAWNRPIICVRLVTGQADDSETESLLREVGRLAKWRTVQTDDEVGRQVELGLRDLTAHSIRGGVAPSRLLRLESALNRSRARCRSKWLSLGLSAEVIDGLLDDEEVGHAQGVSNVASGLVVLCEEFGSGKSLAAERDHQLAIGAARSGGRIPVWLRASEVLHGLEVAVRAKAQGLGDPEVFGVHVVVDGLDEAKVALQPLLEEARELAEGWRGSKLILTSRPDVALLGAPERVALFLLTEEETAHLIALAGGSDLRLHLLSKAVREAVRRPLFALLLGRTAPAGAVPSAPSELVARLVDSALSRSTVGLGPALAAVATATTDHGGPVPLTEVADYESALRSGLLARENDTAYFPLPIVEQWFAARALGGTLQHDELLTDLGRTLRWRYALSVRLAQASTGEADELLSAVAQRSPGVLAWLIAESISSGFGMGIASLPPSLEAGRQLRSAMAGHAHALSGLASLVIPMTNSGKVAQLGVATSANQLTVAVRRSDQLLHDDVVELGPEASLWGNSEWRSFSAGYNAGRSAWAWRYVGDLASTGLDNAIKERALPVAPGLQAEWDWDKANCAARHGSVQEIPVDVLAHLLASYPPGSNVRFSTGSGGSVHATELQAIIDRHPEGSIVPPWPGPDGIRAGHWVWRNYSPEQLSARTHAVLTAALDAYEWMVRTLIPGFGPCLRTHAALPAVLDAELTPQRGDDWEGGPSISWHWDPITDGSPSRVRIQLADSQDHTTHRITEFEQHWVRFSQLRPRAAAFAGYSMHHGVLDIFGRTPAMDAAYQWLKDDLRNIKWIH
jgi:hypothetical protein